MLEFHGLQKTTLVDFPGEVACTLFLGGCPWRCGYCYNADLALNHDTGVCLTAQEALEFLSMRRSFLDGVCLTGGEPLVHATALAPFLRQVKALRYKIKLDTNGSFPERLQCMMQAGLVDYVAMDIKAPLEQYEAVAGAPVVPADLCRSVELIKQSGIRYEFRTTVCAEWPLETFDQIGQWLAGSRLYYLQPICLDRPLLDPEAAQHLCVPTADYLRRVADRLRPYIDEVHVRP